jgi:sugar O-acyltransferase (sialic acid O-acetyltransferase NeuD family)
MKQIGVFGASGCGRGVLPLARTQLSASGQRYALNFVDDNPTAFSINGHQILTYAEWLSQSGNDKQISIAVANGKVRESIARRCADDGVEFFEIRASNVIELDDVQIGEGAILCPFVTLTSNIRIGKHFHANLYSYVEHDCVIGDYVTFAPGAKCNGNIIIEDHAYIGSGAVIKQGSPGSPLVVGRGAFVGMGAVVTKSIPPGVTVMGNPARPVNIKNEE